MRTLFFIIMILPLSLFSTPSDSVATGRIAIGISFSPDCCFRSLKTDVNYKWLAKSRDNMEIPKFGYTTGLELRFKLNKKISGESGLLFSDNGERTKQFSLESLPAGQVSLKYSYNFHYYYLIIPLKIDYTVLSGKFKLYITSGASGNFLVRERTTLITTSSNRELRTTTSSNSGISTFNLSWIAGIGANYPLSSRTIINIEPFYRRSLTSIVKAPVKTFLYSAGINFSVLYTL